MGRSRGRAWAPSVSVTGQFYLSLDTNSEARAVNGQSDLNGSGQEEVGTRRLGSAAAAAAPPGVSGSAAAG
jgi:hypothetical protein